MEEAASIIKKCAKMANDPAKVSSLAILPICFKQVETPSHVDLFGERNGVNCETVSVKISYNIFNVQLHIDVYTYSQISSNKANVYAC